MGNLIIAINDFNEELTMCINNAVNRGVPFSVIEPIIMNMVSQVRSYAKVELDRARAQLTKESVEEDLNDRNS